MPEGTPAVVTDTFDDIPENAASAFASPRLKTTLGVVIINYRTPDLVIQCLAALGPQLSQADAHVVVVDNHSNDASPDAIASYLEQDSFLEKDTDTSWKERISLVRSKENTGFSGGNNIGVSYLDASYYLFLNSDTIVRENALKALLDSAATHPQAGIIGPRLEDLDGTPHRASSFPFSVIGVSRRRRPQLVRRVVPVRDYRPTNPRDGDPCRLGQLRLRPHQARRHRRRGPDG